MLAKVAVLGLPVLTVVVATIIGYINGYPVWAPFSVSVCFIPPILGLIFLQRLVANKHREKGFTYGQVVWGAIPGYILIASAISLLQLVMYPGLYAKEFFNVYNAMKRDGENIFQLTEEQHTKILDHLKACTTANMAVIEMVMFAFIQTLTSEIGKLLMGHRVRNILNNDDIPTVELVIASFCSPVVGILMAMAARFGISTAAMSKPVYYVLFLFMFRNLMRSTFDVGTACYMGLTACKRYVLRAKENWISSLTVAVVLSFAVNLANEVQMAPGTIMSAYVDNGGSISSRTGRCVYWVTSRQHLRDTVLLCCLIAISMLSSISYIKLRPLAYRSRRSNLMEE